MLVSNTKKYICMIRCDFPHCTLGSKTSRIVCGDCGYDGGGGIGGETT